MYRRPKFLEILHEIREEMAREADYDVDLFAEMARTGRRLKGEPDADKNAPRPHLNISDSDRRPLTRDR